MNDFLELYDTHYAPKLGIRADGFRKIFELLQPVKWPIIVETGCLRQPGNWAGDGQSTALFHEFTDNNGEFFSVDIDPHAVKEAKDVVGDADITVSDSVPYLKKFYRGKIDLLYLDSFDLDVKNPMPAAIHHLMELCAAMPSLRTGCIIAIDDNFQVNGNNLGKGMLVYDYFKKLGIEPIFTGYQLVWKL